MSKSIKQENDIPSSNSKCSAITFDYKWTIDNFSLLYDDEAANWKWDISSDMFSPSKNEEFEFLLQLYPRTQHIETYQGYVSIGVGVYDMPQKYSEKINCRWNVSIEDGNGNKCRSRERTAYGLIKYTELLNCASQYLPMDRLTLHVEIHMQADEPIFNVITNNEVGMSRFDCANKVTKVVHIWTIDNFPRLFDPNEAQPHFIQSGNFPVLEEQNAQFRLILYPNGQRGSDKNKVDIVVQNNDKNGATVHYKISLLDVDGEECNTAEVTGRIDSALGKCHGYNRAYLLDNSNGLVYDNKLRIHCEMSYMVQVDSIGHNKICNDPQMLNKSESITDVASKIFNFVSHQWTIDEFSELCANSQEDDCIDSPVMLSPTDNRYKFRIRLWLKGLNQYKNKYVSFELDSASSDFKQVTAQFRMSMLDADGVKFTQYDNQFTISNSEIVRYSDFLPLSRLQDESFIRQYLPNDKLILLCEICAIQDKKKIYKPLTKLNDQLNQSMVNNPTGSATVNMSQANLQGAIINVQGILNTEDIKVTVNKSAVE